MISGFFNRQRLALRSDRSGLLEVAVVIIDTEPAPGADGVVDLLADLRRQLIRTYGTAQTFEEGVLDDDAFAQISAGQPIRNAEWRVPGGVVRLGLPQRLDGQVRAELQCGRSFRPPGVTARSLEEIG